MNKKLHKILQLCLIAKEKGIDAFFWYSPHVNGILIDIHEKGFNTNKDCKTFRIYTDFEDAEEKADKVIDYLKNLLSENQNV